MSYHTDINEIDQAVAAALANAREAKTHFETLRQEKDEADQDLAKAVTGRDNYRRRFEEVTAQLQMATERLGELESAAASRDTPSPELRSALVKCKANVAALAKELHDLVEIPIPRRMQRYSEGSEHSDASFDPEDNLDSVLPTPVRSGAASGTAPHPAASRAQSAPAYYPSMLASGSVGTRNIPQHSAGFARSAPTGARARYYRRGY